MCNLSSIELLILYLCTHSQLSLASWSDLAARCKACSHHSGLLPNLGINSRSINVTRTETGSEERRGLIHDKIKKNNVFFTIQIKQNDNFLHVYNQKGMSTIPTTDILFCLSPGARITIAE